MTATAHGTEPGIVAPERLNAAEFSAENHAALIILQLAKKGHHVSRLENNGFLVSAWTMTLHCPTLENLAQFARKVGAA